MKGIGLSIRTLVLICLAIVILLAIITLFQGTLIPGKESMNCQTTFQTECTKFVLAGGCDKDLGSFNDMTNFDSTKIKEVAGCAIGSKGFDQIQDACC